MPIIPGVAATERRPLADDTPFEIEELQIELWRAMTPQAKGALVAGLCRGVHEAAAEGLRRRHPDASPRELFLRAAMLTLGEDLAVEAFPDAVGLVGSATLGL